MLYKGVYAYNNGTIHLRTNSHRKKTLTFAGVNH